MNKISYGIQWNIYSIKNLVEHLRWRFYEKIVNG